MLSNMEVLPPFKNVYTGCVLGPASNQATADSEDGRRRLLCGRCHPSVRSIANLTVHFDLLEDGEGDLSIVEEGTDLGGRPRLLTTKLIARKGQNDEPFGLQLLIERLQLGIVRRSQASFARHVDHERHLASKFPAGRQAPRATADQAKTAEVCTIACRCAVRICGARERNVLAAVEALGTQVIERGRTARSRKRPRQQRGYRERNGANRAQEGHLDRPSRRSTGSQRVTSTYRNCTTGTGVSLRPWHANPLRT